MCNIWVHSTSTRYPIAIIHPFQSDNNSSHASFTRLLYFILYPFALIGFFSNKYDKA